MHSNNGYKNHRRRDNLPAAIGSIPNTGFDLLVYRGVDSSGKVTFHWRLARRNRAGDGYYATNRVEQLRDVIFAVHFASKRFAMVEELDASLRSELRSLAESLEGLFSARGEEAKRSSEKPNGLVSAFGDA